VDPAERWHVRPPEIIMRTTCYLLLLVVPLAGCARRSPLPAGPAGGLAKASGSGEAAPAYAPWVPAPVGPAYQGRDAGQWAQRLHTREQSSLHEATQALGKLGAEGLPHLVRGMQSNHWETRLSSLQAVERDVMIANSQQVAATLTRLLGDEQPAIRRQAVIRLGWLPADRIKAAVPALRQLAAADPDPETRRSALDAMVAASGRSVRQLVDLLAERNPEVRLQAVAQLKDMNDARAAIPAVRQLAESDPHPGVRQAAANALLTMR